MPAPCTLLLEVFRSALEYDLADEVVDFEVSTDDAHEHPWLMPIRNYGEQEIDPVACAASIGTVQVGVIDVHQTPGDQTTGWMTERVHNVFGRRCRLRRWVDNTIGWVTIADGPAGPPTLDNSYSAYLWTIRDTRDVERKIQAFINNSTAGIVPRGAVLGWGSYEDENGDPQQLLLPLEGVAGVASVTELGDGTGRYIGTVLFTEHFSGGLTPDLLNEDLLIDEEGEKAVAPFEYDANTWAIRNADVLWRPEGSAGPWNVARPVSPAAYRIPVASVSPAMLGTEEVRAVFSALLFFADEIPAGMPAHDDRVEVIIRYRGPASEEYPYYWEGTNGELLADLYSGRLTTPEDLGGLLYDPAALEAEVVGLATSLRFDQTALDAMITPVLMRWTEPVDDGRDWAEAQVYGPSGWIPALDSQARISPVSRNRPEDLTGLPAVTNYNAEPSPDWDAGDRVVTAVSYTWRRYFVPASGAFATEPDGLAVREVSVTFQDPEAEAIHGPQSQDYDATIYGAVGTDAGEPREGIPETASLLVQEARFEVLFRYRGGAQSFGVAVPRSEFPTLRAGDWLTWDLKWLPHRETGVRGGASGAETAAQVLAIKDDDCAWRSILLEESSVAFPPGYYSGLDKTEDEPQSGYYDELGLSSDEPGGS